MYHAYRNDAGVRRYLFFDSIVGPYITFSLEDGAQRIYFGNEYLEQDWLYLSDYDRWIVVPSMPGTKVLAILVGQSAAER